MKNKLTLLTSILIGGIILIAGSGFAVAQTDTLQGACSGQAFSESATCQGRTLGNPILGPDGIITKVAQILVILVSVIAVIMIIVAGFKYIVSAGDANATKSARDTILYAVIGLLVALFAQGIVSFVLRRL